MTLKMEGQLFLLQLVVWACVIAFLVCFAVALYANIMAIRRTGGLINRAEDQDRSWGGTAGTQVEPLRQVLCRRGVSVVAQVELQRMDRCSFVLRLSSVADLSVW